MRTYRVKWCACPHVHNQPALLFVAAETPEDARTLVRDHVERIMGVEWFTVFEPTEYNPPQIVGRILAPGEAR